MPMYEYYCRECDTRLEVLRPATGRDQPVACPGHPAHRPKRLLSVFATRSATISTTALTERPAGGGCACGGQCGCRN